MKAQNDFNRIRIALSDAGSQQPTDNQPKRKVTVSPRFRILKYVRARHLRKLLSATTGQMSGKQIVRLTGIRQDRVYAAIREYDQAGRIPETLQRGLPPKVIPTIINAVEAATLTNR
jgi:hypothetical protein